MVSQETVRDILSEFKDVKANRETWNNLWREVGHYIHGGKINFDEEYLPGEELNRNRYENTGVYSATTLASSLIGILWGNSGRSVKLIPALGVSENEENKEFYERITDILVEELDDPNAGLEVALAEYALDVVAFGTAGLGIFQGVDSGLRFESWSICNLYIAENAHNKVETVFKYHRLTLRQIISTYGLENLSDKLRGLASDQSKLSSRHEILQCVKRRNEYDINKKGSLDMPFMSVHIERDTEHVLKESGFREMPVKVSRFRKYSYEEYGRSPGIDALPDVRELEFLRRRFSTAADKLSDPALVVLNDGSFSGGVINKTAGSINVIDVASGRLNNKSGVISELQTIGDLSPALARMEQLRLSISAMFFLDKLIDYGTGTQMTATEVLLKDVVKKNSIGSILARQIAETFDPLVTRSFNVLFEQGLMGVTKGSEQEAKLIQQGIEPIYIPDEIAYRASKGLPIYKIKYFSPASQTYRAAEAETLNNLLAFKLNVQQGTENIEDVFNADEALKLAAEIGGLPQVVRSDEEIAMIRQQREQQQQQQQMMEMAEQGARAGRDANQAGLI